MTKYWMITSHSPHSLHELLFAAGQPSAIDLDDQILTSHTLTWILYLKKLEALHLALVVVVLLCLLQVQQCMLPTLCLPLLVLLLLDHLLIVLGLGGGTLVDQINPDNTGLLLVLSKIVPWPLSRLRHSDD